MKKGKYENNFRYYQYFIIKSGKFLFQGKTGKFQHIGFWESVLGRLITTEFSKISPDFLEMRRILE